MYITKDTPVRDIFVFDGTRYPVKIANCLVQNKILTFGDLVLSYSYDKHQFVTFRNFGQGCMKHMETILSKVCCDTENYIVEEDVKYMLLKALEDEVIEPPPRKKISNAEKLMNYANRLYGPFSEKDYNMFKMACRKMQFPCEINMLARGTGTNLNGERMANELLVYFESKENHNGNVLY